MSYPPNKAIPLVISDLEETIKLIKRKDAKASDESLEEIFLTIFKDKQSDEINSIAETFFRLHAACQNTIVFRNSSNFEEEQKQKFLNKEFKYKGAADELEISVSQLKKLVREKKLIPKHYSLRDVRITQAEIERYRNMNSH